MNPNPESVLNGCERILPSCSALLCCAVRKRKESKNEICSPYDGPQTGKKTNKIVHVFVRAVRSIKDDGEKWLVVVAVMVLMFACCVMMVFLGPVYNADSQSGPFMSCR